MSTTQAIQFLAPTYPDTPSFRLPPGKQHDRLWAKYYRDKEHYEQWMKDNHERKCERISQILAELSTLMPLKNATPSINHLQNLCIAWQSGGGMCGNPKCSKQAGGRYHDPGMPFSFCSIKCSRIVRAQRFRDKRKAAMKITSTAPGAQLVTNVTSVPPGGALATKVTRSPAAAAHVTKRTKAKKA